MLRITVHSNPGFLTFRLEGIVLSRKVTVAMQPLTPSNRRGGTTMFRKAFSFGGLLLLAGAAVLVTPGSGQAQHRGGGGHGGGFHAGGFHAGSMHGGRFHHGGFNHGGFHHGGFNHGGFNHGFHHGGFRGGGWWY